MKVLNSLYKVYKTYFDNYSSSYIKDTSSPEYKQAVSLIKTALAGYVNFNFIPAQGISLDEIFTRVLYIDRTPREKSNRKYSYKVIYGELGSWLTDDVSIKIIATLTQYPDAFKVKFLFRTGSVRIVSEHTLNSIKIFPGKNKFEIKK